MDMRIIEEFKEFSMRGNVIDMGIGVLLGTAFGKIVDSLVTDVILPPLSVLLGDVDVSNMYITLSGEEFNTLQEAKEHGAITINYGEFMNNIFHFAIIAVASFVTIKQMNKLRKLPSNASVKKSCPYCLTDIPVRAIRCPQCTSRLDKELVEENQDPDRPRINIRAS
jgi:large conductance mechanosensitive channel